MLVVLAAGMGSRYGGLKQFEGVGPGGESILEFSVFDALRSGFEKVVFVIRRDMRERFERELESRFPRRLRYAIAYQSVDDVPGGVSVPAGRVKPWGTAHAVWCARDHVDAPFAVINADDFYGRSAFEALGGYLRRCGSDRELYCLVGYELGSTLTDAGSVSRGVCEVDGDGFLRSIHERTKITREDSKVVDWGEGHAVELGADSVVSMNCWGFTPLFFQRLERELLAFFRGGDLSKDECYLPSAVMSGLGAGVCCEVLAAGKGWCGVTYPADRAAVEQRLLELVMHSEYSNPLWQ